MSCTKDQALKLFNVEIKKSGRGYSVFVTDENGNPVRHPVRMGDFVEKPKFLKETTSREMDKNMSYSINSVRMTHGNEILKELKIQILKSLTNQKIGEPSSIKTINKVNRKRKKYSRKI